MGSLFFTAASFAQLVQSQSPAMTGVDSESQDQPAPVRFKAWLPHDRNWLAAVTQFPGTLFFNISTGATLVHNLTVKQEDRRVWRPDFYGSTLFLVASVFAILALGRFLSFQPRSRLAHCLAEHDRIDLVHGLSARELCPSQHGRVDQQPRLDHWHAAGCRLLPGRSHPDVPSMEAGGPSNTARST